MPHFLLTSTTYGTWLPGDPRGSVTAVRDRRPGDAATTVRRRHNQLSEAYEPPIEGLRRSARQAMRSEPVWLLTYEAETALRQFRETAKHRGCQLLAGTVMANHFHLVLGFDGRKDCRRLLSDLKTYATRALESTSDCRHHAKWWTRGGSTRPLPNDHAVQAAIHYVLHRQSNVLASYAADP